MVVVIMAKPKLERLNIDSKQKKYLLKKLEIENILDIDTVILKRLKENLKDLTDSRQQSKITYKIWDVNIYKRTL